MQTRSSSSPHHHGHVGAFAGTPLTLMGDSDLVASVMERGVLREVFDRHGAAVEGLAHRLAGASAAEDVVQEVFLRLWSAPERFQPGRGTLRTFLLNEARGRSLDLLRSEAARRDRERGDGVGGDPNPDDVESTVIAHGGHDRVWKVVLGLPPGERQAVALAFFGGFSYREVAEVLGQPPGTVKSRIRRGLGRMRVELAANRL